MPSSGLEWINCPLRLAAATCSDGCGFGAPGERVVATSFGNDYYTSKCADSSSAKSLPLCTRFIYLGSEAVECFPGYTVCYAQVSYRRHQLLLPMKPVLRTLPPVLWVLLPLLPDLQVASRVCYNGPACCVVVMPISSRFVGADPADSRRACSLHVQPQVMCSAERSAGGLSELIHQLHQPPARHSQGYVEWQHPAFLTALPRRCGYKSGSITRIDYTNNPRCGGGERNNGAKGRRGQRVSCGRVGCRSRRRCLPLLHFYTAVKVVASSGCTDSVILPPVVLPPWLQSQRPAPTARPQTPPSA